MLIKNGLVFDYRHRINGVRLDIHIEDGKIQSIDNEIAPLPGEQVIDAAGYFVIPGIIDMHTHLRQPGAENKETIATGTRAAAKGGVTTVLAMPNTNPPLDNPSIFSEMQSIIAREGVIDVKLASTMTRGREGLEAVNFAQNIEAGYIAFTDDGSPVENIEVIIEISQRAQNTGALLIEHPETLMLSGNAPCSYGKIAEILGISGQPAESESLDILRFGTIAGMFGARIHFTHISTKKSVEAVRMLKRLYPGRITADTTPHHLRLSEDDNLLLNTNLKMNPPLRPEEDRIAIEQGVIFGSIDAIASDHAPHTFEDKNTLFSKAPFGVIGLETLLPVVFTHLVKQHRSSMLNLVKLLCTNPARILGLENVGSIEVGGFADITIFDPKEHWTITPDFFVSKSKNSPFYDKDLWGRVKKTIFRGKLVYEE